MRRPVPLLPSFKVIDNIDQFNRAFTNVDMAANSISAYNWYSCAHTYSNNARSLIIPSCAVVPGASGLEMIDQGFRLRAALNKIDLFTVDNFINGYSIVQNRIKFTSTELENKWFQSDSALRIQALKAELRHSRQAFKGRYYQTLRTLRDILDEADFKKLAREISNHLESVRNLFSRLHGKIRALSKTISLVNGSIDRRVVYRKKNKVIFKKSDDEDINK